MSVQSYEMLTNAAVRNRSIVVQFSVMPLFCTHFEVLGLQHCSGHETERHHNAYIFLSCLKIIAFLRP